MTITESSQTSLVTQLNASRYRGDVARNRQIVAFAKKKGRRWSYQLIGDHFGVTRSAVAGILWRERHPHKTRINSPNSTGPNKIGTGRRPAPYYPEKTARNNR